MKLFFVIVLLMMSFKVSAESSSLNLALPNTNQPYSSDRIRAGNLECQNAIGGSTNLEFGVVGILNQNGPYNNYYDPTFELPGYDSNGFVRDVGVYAKITVPLNAPKERLNCNALYKLELERRRLEIQKLKEEVANLRRLQFADEGSDGG